MFLRKPSDTLYSFENFGYIIPIDSKIKLVFLDNGKKIWLWLQRSYNLLITMFCKMTLEVKLETTNNLIDKILSANSIAKSSYAYYNVLQNDSRSKT
jgi:hypothetical protein